MILTINKENVIIKWGNKKMRVILTEKICH